MLAFIGIHIFNHNGTEAPRRPLDLFWSIHAAQRSYSSYLKEYCIDKEREGEEVEGTNLNVVIGKNISKCGSESCFAVQYQSI